MSDAIRSPPALPAQPSSLAAAGSPRDIRRLFVPASEHHDPNDDGENDDAQRQLAHGWIPWSG